MPFSLQRWGSEFDLMLYIFVDTKFNVVNRQRGVLFVATTTIPSFYRHPVPTIGVVKVLTDCRDFGSLVACHELGRLPRSCVSKEFDPLVSS